MPGIGRTLLTPNFVGMGTSIINDPNIEWKVGGISVDPNLVAVAAAAAAIAAPVVPTAATSTTGGSLPGDTYYLSVTNVMPGGGETTVSPEVTQVVPTTTTTNIITVTAPTFGSGAVGAKVYLRNLSGTVNFSRYVASSTTTTIVVRSLPKTGALAPPTLNLSGSADGSVLWPDGTKITAGQKAIRYGQLMCLVTSGAYTGYYGPYDSAASDGRQTPTVGLCGLMPEAQLLYSDYGIQRFNTENFGVVTGGRVFINRCLHCEAGTPGLAAGPTKAVLLAALPRLIPTYNN